MALYCAQRLRLSKFVFCVESCFHYCLLRRNWASSSTELLGTWQGRSITVTSGKYARLADSSCVAECDNSAVMVTVVGKQLTSPADFLPLTVDFQQKTSALGRIPTNFFRRDRGASEQEILSARVVDRSIRPLFPPNINMEMQIVCNMLSMDENGDPEVLAVNATSAALALSNIPWGGPVGAVRVGFVDEGFIINPSQIELKQSCMNIIIVGHKDGAVMMEMGGNGVSTSVLFPAIKKGLVECEAIASKIRTLAKANGKVKIELSPVENSDDLGECVRLLCEEDIKKTFLKSDHDKLSRDNELKNILSSATVILLEQNPCISEDSIKRAYYTLVKKTCRELILELEIRCDGRRLQEVRPIKCETTLYKPLHGSSVFQRGQTQVLCSVSLDSHDSALKLDPYSQLTSGLKEKNFFLHYEFPQYAVNEIGKTSSVGRREFGHGALAERALRPVIPKDYPFTIRLTSEVLESNGSSSMASVCGGTLALLDAGVPISSSVSGVAIGLVTKCDADDPKKIVDYRILTDLMGMEDFFGDMDFKVSCSRSGFTAAQLDIKIPYLPLRILFEALLAAQKANGFILNLMKLTLGEPRDRKDDMVPVVQTIEIPQNKIGKLYGMGGQNIKRMLLETGAHLTHVDGIQYSLFAPNARAFKDAKTFIDKIVQEKNAPELEFGCIYTAKIVELRDIGIMVTLHDGMTPQLVHNSQLDHRKVSHPSVLGFQEGQEIQLKYFGLDPSSGHMRLSRKVLQGSSGTAHNFYRTTAAPILPDASQTENNSKTDS